MTPTHVCTYISPEYTKVYLYTLSFYQSPHVGLFFWFCLSGHHIFLCYWNLFNRFGLICNLLDMFRPQLVVMKFGSYSFRQDKKFCEDGGFWGLCLISAKFNKFRCQCHYCLMNDKICFKNFLWLIANKLYVQYN